MSENPPLHNVTSVKPTGITATYLDAFVGSPTEGKIRAKVRLLEELAYHFSCEGKEIFSIDDLYDWIEEYLQGNSVSSVFRNRNSDSDELITELSEEDGILQKLTRDGDKYLFLHRTFQEYLTASYLNRASDGIALGNSHFWEYDWHETLSLLAGLMENPVPLLQAIAEEKDDMNSVCEAWSKSVIYCLSFVGEYFLTNNQRQITKLKPSDLASDVGE